MSSTTSSNITVITGARGPRGFQGATGSGARGVTGFQGNQGPQGRQGLKGNTGNVGSTGPQGNQGNTGVQGPTGSNTGTVYTLTDTSTVTPDFSVGNNFTWTLGAAGRTLANPSNLVAGQSGLIFILQDAGGSRTITSWGSYYKWSGGVAPSLSTAAYSLDILTYFVRTNTSIVCQLVTGFA